MARKPKKTAWFWKPKVIEPEKQQQLYTPDGNKIDWEDEIWGGYDDWDAKPKDHKDIDWSGYEKTGHWRGYESYKASTLSYSYVEQVANMIAAQHNVKIQVGNGWGVDIDSKTLTYNPISLMYMSKGELVATLLHEVGKIALCLSIKNVSNPYVTKYGQPAYDVLSVFDDFRVDDRMIKSYPSAGEVYESLDGILMKVVKTYQMRGTIQERNVKNIVENGVQNIEANMQTGVPYEKAYREYFNYDPVIKNFKAFKEWAQLFMVAEFPSIWNYIATVVDKGYGVNTAKHTAYMEELFNKTSLGVGESVKQNGTQEVADMMNTAVYPVIEEMLKVNQGGTDQMKQGLGEGASERVMKSADWKDQQELQGQGVDPNNMSSRGGGRGTEDIPREWVSGDYMALKDSVETEIKSLYQKMLNLRRAEQVAKFQLHQKRGKLNSKVLYQHRTGGRRLFKKKEEQVDTISSFTFSIMVDSSGSMKGSRIAHTTRALIMLSEVFKKLNMQFEIIHFEGSAKMTKSFDQEYDKKVKDKVASYTKGNGGGTRLESALEKTQLVNRKEMNRVAIVLTDGDTEDHTMLNTKYFSKWDKQGIRSIVMGLETGDQIKSLNNGKGEVISNSAEVPQRFFTLLKSLIFKK